MSKNLTYYYFSHYDLFRPRTNQISDVRFCEGFAQNGIDIKFYSPYSYRKDNAKRKDLFSLYGVETSYSIKILPTPFRGDFGGAFNMLLLSAINCMVMFFIMLFSSSKKVIMSRNPTLLIPAIMLKKVFSFKKTKVVFWGHEISTGSKINRFVYENVDSIIATNSKILEDLKQDLGLDYTPDQITLNPITELQVKNKPSKENSRKLLNLNIGKPLIVYTGKIFIGMKELEFILEAAKRLKQYQFLITGGKPKVLNHYNNWCSEQGVDNVTFTGYLPDYSEIQYYQNAADALICFYTRKEHNVNHNLPQKIGEYMITGAPIVAADWPANRDMLSANNAILVDPENVDSFISGISQAIEGENSEQLAKQAFKDIKEWTFKKRTALINRFLTNE